MSKYDPPARDPHDGLQVVWETINHDGGLLKREKNRDGEVEKECRYYLDVYAGVTRSDLSFGELVDLHRIIGEEIERERAKEQVHPSEG